jgi:hypothetical protein
MAAKKSEGRGPAFATGGLRKPREDLVAWPSGPTDATIIDAAPPSNDPDDEDVHAQLARAKREIRRLLTRIQELSEENERLRK